MTPEDVAEEDIVAHLRDAAKVLETGYSPIYREKPKRVAVPIPETEAQYRTDPDWLPAHMRRGNVRVADKTYVIRSGDFVKIGIAHDIERRFRDIMSLNPHDVECLVVLAGGRALERSLHLRFAAHRHRDEWFRIEGELAAWIERGFADET